MSTRKENMISAALGLMLACVAFGICLYISVKRDRDVFDRILVITRASESRVGEVLHIQWAMTRVIQDILTCMSEDSLSEEKISRMREHHSELDKLALRQLDLMKNVTAQQLPEAPLRIWASKSLRDKYFAERAQLLVLQDRIHPILVSAGYLTTALDSRNADQS